MKKLWFKDWKSVYYPISWEGYSVTFFLFAFCVHIFIFVDRYSHSVSDTFYSAFPFIVPTLIILWLVASHKSR